MKNILIITFLLICLESCTESFLDAKPDTNLITPQNLQEIIGLLDNTSFLNFTGGLGQMGADEYVFIDYESWLSTFSAVERNAYIWSDDIYEGQNPVRDWDNPYRSIFYANNALKTLDVLSLPPSADKNQVKGWALFIRAYAYHDLLRNFTLAYDPSTADSDLGLPIRLTPNIDEIHPRSTLQQTYDQLISDLQDASSLLTEMFQETNRNRPSKASAFALLSRVYLSMNNFDDAEKYADSSLMFYNRLIDYNFISVSGSIPFLRTNPETLFSAAQVSAYNITANAVWNTAVTINPEIYNTYDKHDLRKQIFFGQNPEGNYYVKTGYMGGGSYPFHGLAVDELYLIKSECLARRGEIDLAMSWLNSLLKKRYLSTEPYIDLTASDIEDALEVILMERKKELIWRGIRWSDIKRLNKLGANITLKRNLNGTEYTLPPNDLRFAFPIPDDEITRSHIQQNSR